MHPARQRFCSFCLSFPDAARSQPHVFFQLERKPTCPSPRAVAAIASSLQVCRDCPIPVVFYFFQTSSQVSQAGFLTLSSSRG
uniref:Brain cDNA, clone MNCb-0553 n=1 Tax=Mus musculus TaxID=10090 RepID=Q9JJ86_MOUSE|nr:unnamed protein product [Mus musculus]